MITRMNRKTMSEWFVLDLLLLFGTIFYSLVQYIKNGKIVDSVFIMLLFVATVFLNARQVKLFNSLTSTEGVVFFTKLFPKEEYERQIKNIFVNPIDTLIAVIFALMFSIVIYMFQIWEGEILIKWSFSVFIFVANVPTGYAIIRIFKYFYYNSKWINELDFQMGAINHSASDYIRKLCMEVLFSAATYCAVSLSSIMFTEIELNFIVICYTIFALILVGSALFLTNIIMQKRARISKLRTVDEIDNHIRINIAKRINDEKHNEDDMLKIRELIEIREVMLNQNKSKIDIEKIVSGMGLLFITIIPIIVQWILDKIQ